MAPFRGIFTPVELDGNAVLDTSIIFAMVIYGIIALVLRAFLDWLNVKLDKLERERIMEEQQQAAMAAGAQVQYQTPPPAATYPDSQAQQAPVPQTQAPPPTPPPTEAAPAAAPPPYPDAGSDPSAPRH